jgi:hypothetical protein
MSVCVYDAVAAAAAAAGLHAIAVPIAVSVDVVPRGEKRPSASARACERVQIERAVNGHHIRRAWR